VGFKGLCGYHHSFVREPLASDLDCGCQFVVCIPHEVNRLLELGCNSHVVRTKERWTAWLVGKMEDVCGQLDNERNCHANLRLRLDSAEPSKYGHSPLMQNQTLALESTFCS
jgi:hypothetical protein